LIEALPLFFQPSDGPLIGQGVSSAPPELQFMIHLLSSHPLGQGTKQVDNLQQQQLLAFFFAVYASIY